MKECGRSLECVVIRWCELARTELGNMLECWLMKDMPEAPEPEADEFDNLTLEQILMLQDQATNQQRTGAYAEGIAIALEAQASLLERIIPEPDDDLEQPETVGFGQENSPAEIRIRTVGLFQDEPDPCAIQRTV